MCVCATYASYITAWRCTKGCSLAGGRKDGGKNCLRCTEWRERMKKTHEGKKPHTAQVTFFDSTLDEVLLEISTEWLMKKSLSLLETDGSKNTRGVVSEQWADFYRFISWRLLEAEEIETKCSLLHTLWPLKECRKMLFHFRSRAKIEERCWFLHLAEKERDVFSPAFGVRIMYFSAFLQINMSSYRF